MMHAMFHLPLPLLEKILRPIIVYFFLIFLLRVFGKRELAQLNPFDLVVLLSLSNVVQNALIGKDDSITGGIVGAASLLTINWLFVRFLYSSPRIDRIVEGTERVLVRNGVLDEKALRKERLTHQELMSAVHSQGFGGIKEIKKCVLDPNGAIHIEGRTPTESETNHGDLIARLERIQQDVHALRRQLPAG